MKDIQFIRNQLHAILPTLRGNLLSFVVEENGRLRRVAQFRSFREDETEIQSLITSFSDRQIIVQPENQILTAYASAETYSATLKLIHGQFVISRYSLLLENYPLRPFHGDGASITELAVEHLKKERQRLSS